jgi:hypothetical protein
MSGLKMWYICTMEFYSAFKKNEMMSFDGECVEMEIITFREISQSYKVKYCLFSFIYGSEAGNKHTPYSGK